jgi:integrase/recombinase XerC
MTYHLGNKYLTTEEEQLAIKAILTMPEELRVYFQLLLATGIRETEGLDLSPSQLIKDRCSVHVFGIKGSNDREVPLERILFNDLLKLAEESQGSLVFPNLYQRLVCRAWHKVRPCQKPIHSLRHTFAVNLYRRSRDIKLVQYALGHKSLNNTLIYTEIDQSADLAKVLRGS